MNADAFDRLSRRMGAATSRRGLLKAFIAGIAAALAGTWLRPAPARAAVTISCGSTPICLGMCYEGFPQPYDPSTAETTCLFEGSDAGQLPMEPLWGPSYTGSKGTFRGRDDVATIRAMGVNLIRPYDWAPRDNHLAFLDYCERLGIKVLAAVSNYFVRPDQGYPNRLNLIPELIRSYTNAAGTDYHPAFVGIIVGNEPRLNNFSVTEDIGFTNDYVSIEAGQFGGYRKLPIGHPVDFNEYGGEYPCWGFWDALVAPGTGLSDAAKARLFLAPQTYNPAGYLYTDVGGSGSGKGHGYVPITFARYSKPILFTEIGQSRIGQDPNFLTVVKDQLCQSAAYGQVHPEQLLGVAFFEFGDKVWKCPTNNCTDSEGSFGAFSHSTTITTTVTYSGTDFTHDDSGNCNGQNSQPLPQLNVDQLVRNPMAGVVTNAFNRSSCLSGCGTIGNPCCNGVCSTGACSGGQCVACGATGNPCCAGNACNAGLTCNAGTCGGGGGNCGGANQLCCNGAVCNTGFNCSYTNCVACGASGGPCCTSGTPCSNGLTCTNNTCSGGGGCGDYLQPCCGGNSCNTAGLTCSGGTCQQNGTCGSPTAPCCTGSLCYQSSNQHLICQNSKCVFCGSPTQPCCGGTTACYGGRCFNGSCVA